MKPVNLIAPQVSTTFQGKNKKALEVIDKVIDKVEIPKKRVLNPETKAALDKDYLEAHKKVGEVMQELAESIKKGILFPARNLTPEQAKLERMNGMLYSSLAKDKKEFYSGLTNEYIAGNRDFMEGAIEYLANKAAKTGYKK